MPRYELSILASPEITKDEESKLETHIDKLINKFKGLIISFDRWGKYRLAYPVKRNDYGVYFLLRLNTEDTDIIKEIERMFYVKFNSIVMRSIFSRLDLDQSLEYKRPPSLEDTPKKPIGFFKDKELRPRSTSFSKKDKEVKEAKFDAEESKVKKEEPLRQASPFAKATEDTAGRSDIKKEEAVVSEKKEVNQQSSEETTKSKDKEV